MVRRRPSHELARLLVLGALGAGCAASSGTGAPARPRGNVVDGTWKIASHVISTTSSLTHEDARGMYYRAVEVGAGYTTPWHGHCEHAGRQRRARVLADVTTELGVSSPDRATAVKFGLGPDLVEYRLMCADPARSLPPLVIYVDGDRGMTCYGGICYLLAH
ncbi:MAG: hypothetical protein ACTHU0_35390 [Kofleriaceae bacterium]